MKYRIKNILIALFSIISGLLYSQCQIVEDFNSFNTTGMSTTIEWNPVSSNAVVCNSSDWQPSFFVNNDSLINVRVTGEIYVSSTTNEDDFVGFVFGYKSPTIGTAANDNHFYLFDWKKVGQHAPAEYGGFLAKEGFNLSYANGLIPGDEETTYRYFWGHEETDGFIPMDHKYGGNYGWEYNTLYEFELIYTYNKIKISIDEDLIFEVDGCFPSGLFGLYSFNQNGTLYSNVKYEQYYDISFQTDQETFCEERSVSFSFLDADCSYPPSSLSHFEWNFNDGSPVSYALNPEHTFFDSGSYEIELHITNTEGCVDVITKSLFIEPKPIVLEHPEDVQCIVGDVVSFVVEADYDESYQWYYQSKEMTSWRKMTNNGYFSGVTSPELKVYNVRPSFDEMKFRCHVDGVCFNPVVTQYAQIFITDIPVRADLSCTEAQICDQDPAILLISLQEPYQIKSAHLRFHYDSTAFQVADYTTYSQNMNFEWNIGSSFVDIGIYVTNPVNLDQIIIASINLNGIAAHNQRAVFNWDPEFTYFINENEDTILNVLNDSEILINQAASPNYEDTIYMCRGESISLDENLFAQINWSTGEDSPNLFVEDEGLFWVDLIDYNHCHTVDSFYLIPEELPEQVNQMIFQKPYFCSFDDSIVLTVEGGKGSYLQFEYHDLVFIDSVVSDKEYRFLNPHETTELKVYWGNTCGQSEELSALVEVYPQAIPYVELLSDHEELELGQSVSFRALSEDAGEDPNYIWMIDEQIVQEGPENVFETDQLRQNQKVSVILYSSENCILGANSVETFLNIKMPSGPEFYVPSLVTPNGDGLNDAFKILFRNPNISEFLLQVYDLRGRLVHQTNDPNEEWYGHTGNPNGIPEIFTYYISYKKETLDTKEVTGKFLLKK